MSLITSFYWVLLSLTLQVSSPSPSPNIDLSGNWERIDDAWEGMKISIIQENNTFNGILEFVPEKARKGGFKAGDLKWENLQWVSANTFHFSDLSIRPDHLGNVLSSQRLGSYLEIIDEDKIKTWVYVPNNNWIGQEQIWVRKKDPIAGLIK